VRSSATRSPFSKVEEGAVPHALGKVSCKGRETRSGFEVEPDLALVKLQTRVEGPPGF
jgi:hypothetical protein